MTLVTLSDLNRAGFKLYIENFSEIQNAEEDHVEYYCLEPGLGKPPTDYFPISKDWRVHCCRVLEVNCICLASIYFPPPTTIIPRSPIEDLCCFEETVRNIIWSRTICSNVNILHSLIRPTITSCYHVMVQSWICN